MSDKATFRVYFNNHLHSLLQQLERERKWLLALIGIAILAFGGALWIIYDMGIPALTLFIALVFVAIGTLLMYRLRVFKNRFKPRVLPVILGFIDPEFKYYSGEYIAWDTVKRSGLIGVTPQIYRGEDYIKGQIGEVLFEMCELDVRHPSNVLNRMDELFRGIFLHATFEYNFKGRIFVLPREDVQNQSRTIKAITKTGGTHIRTLGEEFDKYFIAYADKDTGWQHLLTPAMIEGFIRHRKRTKKRLWVSFVTGHFYAGVEQPYDLLEPNIFSSNVDFELAWEYLQDLQIMTNFVRDFDVAH